MDGFDPAMDCGGCCGEMGGGGACETWVMWREHYYWNHMSDAQKQFLVRMASDDFRNSMHLPSEAGSNMRNLLSESEPVQLEAPGGSISRVVVRKEFGNVVFRSGWNDFVNEHNIEQNDHILFVYRGNSRFKVSIFKSDGSEKFLSYSQPPPGFFGGVPPAARCDHHVLNEQVVPNPGHATSADFDYIMLPGCSLTNALDEKVMKIAGTMRSKTPLYVVAMSKRNVSLKDCYVYIPLRLVDNFKEEKTEANVQLEAPDNKTYCVGASKHSDNLIVIESGWKAVVASLLIKENDLLIFKSKGKNRLEVLILDPSGSEKTSFQIVDPLPHQVIDLGSSDEDDIMREDMTESCKTRKQVTRSCAKTEKITSTSSPSAKSGYGAHKPHDRASVKLGVGSEPLPSNLDGPSQRPYIFAQRTSLPWQVQKKVDDKVQQIGSVLPIFVRLVTSNNVDGIGCTTCEMVFCREYAKAYLPHTRQTLFLQLEGEEKLWETTFAVGSGKMRISIGWKEFSRKNKLEVDDVCLFKLEDASTSSSLKMTVYLIRKSQI